MVLLEGIWLNFFTRVVIFKKRAGPWALMNPRHGFVFDEVTSPSEMLLGNLP